MRKEKAERGEKMKIKEFINELQKRNPDAEIFVEDLAGFFAVTGVVDYNGNDEVFIIENEIFPSM